MRSQVSGCSSARQPRPSRTSTRAAPLSTSKHVWTTSLRSVPDASARAGAGASSSATVLQARARAGRILRQVTAQPLTREANQRKGAVTVENTPPSSGPAVDVAVGVSEGVGMTGGVNVAWTQTA